MSFVRTQTRILSSGFSANDQPKSTMLFLSAHNSLKCVMARSASQPLGNPKLFELDGKATSLGAHFFLARNEWGIQPHTHTYNNGFLPNHRFGHKKP